MLNCRNVGIGLLLASFPSCVSAQCPPSASLTQAYQTVVVQPEFPKYPKLNQVVQHWESCRYPQDSQFIELLYQLAKDAGYYRKDSLALQTARRALLIAQTTPASDHPEDLPKTLFRMGKVQLLLSDFTAASGFLTKTIDASLERNCLHWAAMAASEIAFIQFNKGDHESSLTWTTRGIAWATTANDPEGLINNQYERVRVLFIMNKTAEALRLAQSIVQRSQSIPSLYLDLPIHYRMVGNLLTLNGRHSEAEPYLLQSLERTRQLQNEEKIASCELELGFYYYDLAKYDRSLHYYQRALRKAKDFNRQARLYNNIGAVYWKKKDFASAISYYQKGLVALRTDVKSTTGFSANPSAGSIRTSAYKEYLLTLIQDKADTWLGWAKATRNNPSYLRNALNTYALADTMIDFMRWEHSGQQSKLFWRDKTHFLYEQAIETSFRLNDAASAFRFLEKSRAVLLNDKLNELGANRQLSPTQAADEQRLRQQTTNWQARLGRELPNTPAYARALDSLRLAQQQQETFLRQLERANPAYYRYKYDNQVISLKEVRAQLAEQKSTLVTYFVGDQTVYALGITPTTTKFVRFEATVYTRLASELLTLNANPDAQNRQFNDYLKISNQLYQKLIAPLAPEPGRVIVSPDGVLLPFEALSRSDQQPDFLVHRYAFSYAYSVNRLFKKGPETSGDFARPPGSFLGVAPVRFSAHLHQVSLAGSDAALERIGALFPKPTLLAGPSATRQAFGHQARHYQIIQLFTHAEADSSAIEPALFFTDSTLRLSELTGTGLLPTELVGLSACKTGIGANQRGEGVFSLARGFSFLGVPSVLTTVWNVESLATYDLTERFYTHLAEGLPKDIALRQAKLDYLATADRTGQLPSRWAGLLLVGDAQPLHRKPPLPFWSLGLGGLILAASWWWLRRRKRARSDLPGETSGFPAKEV
ncbi:CHAT domain-containing protein [Larkinella bovis]|uniref:CHAT domain-containing protein n=1 Tax=Larkinella bovis TaxID=683041 RepID=A0ABW0IAZ8_9BACT